MKDSRDIDKRVKEMELAGEKEAKVAFKISIRIICCPCIFPHELHDSNEIQSFIRPSAFTINTLSQTHIHARMSRIWTGGSEHSLCSIRITPISQYKQKHGVHYNTQLTLKYLYCFTVSVCGIDGTPHTHTGIQFIHLFFHFPLFLSSLVYFFGKKCFVAVEWRSFDFLSFPLFSFYSNLIRTTIAMRLHFSTVIIM